MEQRSMNELTDKKLHNMTVPAVSMKAHQVHLKDALLAASHPHDKSRKTTKTRWSNLMTKKKFMLSGMTTAFAALAIVAVSLVTMLSPVSAAELTQQSLDKVSQLSPDALQALQTKVNGDPKAELEAAKHAKDLQILTYDELQKLDNSGSNSTFRTAPTDSNNDGPSSLEGRDLKYLRYTDSDGTVHTIGVGKDGLPVIVMTFRNNGDGSSQGSVMVTGGKSGTMTTLGGSASASAMPAGMVSCANTGGSVKCTNSDGSPAPTPNCQSTTSGEMTCSAAAQVKP
jgi:hypothetical protein